MNRRILAAVLAALVAAVAFVAHQPAASAAAPVRIMPLGDSITGSPGCWRALLWNRLRNAGYTDIDFVGTLPAQSCGVAYDGDNEGHGGYLATNIANQNMLPGWLSTTRPDIVIMHLGTNDVWNNIAPSTILAAFGKLVDQMRASNPNMKILVARILPMNPAGCSDCGQRVINFNNAIPGWASAKSTANSPISVVDQWSGFSTSADTSDGVHPNNSGIQKISERWFPALRALLTPTTTTPSTPSTPGGGSSTLLAGFEGGTDSWTGSGLTGGPWRVTEWASQGGASLKADVALGSGRQFYLARFAGQNLSTRATLRATVRVAGWGAHGSGTTAKLYVKTGAGWQWFESAAATVTTGTGGTTLSLNLANVANRADVREIGVQFTAAGNSSGSSAIYLDNVSVQ